MVQRHICLTFLHWQWHCAFLNVSSNHLQEETQSHIGCICMTYLHCVFHMFPHCTRIRAGIVPLVAFVWLFFTVHLKMCPRIACPRRGIVTLVAFVWLSPVCVFKCALKLFAREDAKSHRLHFCKGHSHIGCIVRFQMSPQMACIRRCIFTLLAFVWLLSTVRFHMSPQIACLWGCKVT